MKKKIVLLLAAILCLSMLLASCDWFGRKGEATFNSIIDPNWAGLDEEKLSVLSSNGEAIDLKCDNWYSDNSNYLVLSEEIYNEENGTWDETKYVYEISTANLILTLANSREALPQVNGESFTRERVTEYYVDLIDKDSFAVLTVAYDYISSYSYVYQNYGYTFNSSYFSAYDIPNVRSEYEMNRNDIDINMDIRVDVYGDASAVSAQTFSWETVSNWTDTYNNSSDYFDECYELSVIKEFDDEDDEDYDTLGVDLIVKGTEVYRVDEDGNKTLVKDFGASAMPKNIYCETEEYYISYSYYSENNSYAYTYYDKNLNEQFTYVAPQYYMGSAEMGASQVYVLNNGNLLVQYSKGLEADANKYDYRVPSRYSESRYDLVTLLVDPMTGEETELDFDYVIGGVARAYVADTDKMCWADGVENIVYANPIEDKLIRNDSTATDWLNMTNEGKVKGSVKFDDSLITVPRAYAGSYLAAENIKGETVIFNADGEVVNTVSDENGTTIIGNYILTYMEYYDSYYGHVTEYNALYDIAGNKLYDFKEKKAEIYTYLMDYDAFITKYSEGGEIKYDVVFEGQVADSFAVGAGESLTWGSAYYERTVKTGTDENGNETFEYRLYNVKGELVLKSEYYISVLASTEDCVIVSTTVEDAVTHETSKKFYRFNMVED